jgi:integrase
MPRAFEMSWEGAPAFRWVKMYKGTRYRISCAELGAMVWTKEATAKLANAWWEKKRAELDGDPVRVEAARRILAGEDELSRKARELLQAREVRDQRLLDLLEKKGGAYFLDLLEDLAYRADEMERAKGRAPDAVPQVEGMFLPPPLPIDDANPAPDLLQAVARMPELDELVAMSTAQPAELTDRAVKTLADRWAATRQEEARKGVRSADGADGLRIALSHFVTFAGPATDVGAIDSDLWHRWFVHCRGEVARREGNSRAGWSADYAKKVFSVARSFVRFLWEREHLATLPRNLGKREYRFEAEARTPPTFSNDEVKFLLEKATGQHTLHLLLMLNCGMTQKDISDLRKDQIDLAAGTITRRRSKTAQKKSTPLVCYPLWPETARLLAEHLSADPARALLTESGRPWVRKEMLESGRLKKADNIATLFQHLRRKTGISKSLKVFRKTSATRLKGSKEYRDLRFFFLGHSDRTVADRHYAAESQELFAEAVAWLGRQYGLLP